MRVILTQDIKNLGLKGEIKEVTLGYARNFLIPKGLAEAVTPQTLKKALALKALRVKREKEERKKAQKIAEKLEKLSLVIPVEVSEEGKLFGSVTSSEIIQEIKNKTGLELNKRDIILNKPIKKVGEYEVEIKLFKDIKASIKLKIKKKKTK